MPRSSRTRYAAEEEDDDDDAVCSRFFAGGLAVCVMVYVPCGSRDLFWAQFWLLPTATCSLRFFSSAAGCNVGRPVVTGLCVCVRFLVCVCDRFLSSALSHVLRLGGFRISDECELERAPTALGVGTVLPFEPLGQPLYVEVGMPCLESA